MAFTSHVRKDVGNGLACVRMLQNGRIWQQMFSKISGPSNMLRAGFYTAPTSTMAHQYEAEGWQIVSLCNCVEIGLDNNQHSDKVAL